MYSSFFNSSIAAQNFGKKIFVIILLGLICSSSEQIFAQDGDIQGGESYFAVPKNSARKAVRNRKPEAVRVTATMKTAAPRKWSGLIIGSETVSLNAEAVSLPQPVLTVKSNQSESVKVAVIVDENGRVIQAKAKTDVKNLRFAAELAARQARFNPPMFTGKSARQIGVLVYCFDGRRGCQN